MIDVDWNGFTRIFIKEFILKRKINVKWISPAAWESKRKKMIGFKLFPIDILSFDHFKELRIWELLISCLLTTSKNLELENYRHPLFWPLKTLNLRTVDILSFGDSSKLRTLELLTSCLLNLLQTSELRTWERWFLTSGNWYQEGSCPLSLDLLVRYQNLKEVNLDIISMGFWSSCQYDIFRLCRVNFRYLSLSFVSTIGQCISGHFSMFT